MNNDNSLSDQEYMQLAIALGEKARGTAPPNPWVGALIVKNGVIIGKGYSGPKGSSHAEIHALEEAGEEAEGSTIYITLEPCSHEGATPPCVEALIKAKVKRVVVALEDPDPLVKGQGFKRLREADISYEVGILENQASDSLRPYLVQRSTGKPFVVAKAAISLDGRIAAKDGSSKWISNEDSRKDAHFLRLSSQAILVGSNTALKDNPTLNVRGNEVDLTGKQPPYKQPLRVLFDRLGKINYDCPLLDQKIAKTLIFTSSSCKSDSLEFWKKKGVEVVVIKETANGKLDIEEALFVLGKRNIIQLLVEGGGELLGSFLERAAIDRLVLYIGSIILGDEGLPIFKTLNINDLKNAPRLELISSKELNGCLRVEYDCSKIKKDILKRN